MKVAFNLVLVFVLVFTQAVQAKTKHALLVSVSNYYYLDKGYQLDGPKNDAVIVNRMLLDRGFDPANITQLVSSTKKNDVTEPTRANILAALSKLASNSKKGDFIYLHFAGHGSRQPAKTKSNDEADGLDEIFLAADAKNWNDSIAAVENAITDNEVATYIDKIRSNGSDVWVVFDSCHSGSMTRGIGQSGVRYRKILAKDLGVPEIIAADTNLTESRLNHGTRTRGFASSSQINNDTLGDLITFSAAQSEETTPEMSLPQGESKSRYHGLFTYALVEVLTKNRGLSYQQLAQQVISHYQNIPWHNTTPLISATDMNATVFNEGTGSVSQWKALRKGEMLSIPAGRFSRFSEGAIIALYSEATAKKIIARALVSKSSAMQSTARIDSLLDNKKIDISKLPDDLYVRLLTPQVDFQLAVKAIQTKGMSKSDFIKLKNSITEVAKNNPLLIREEERIDAVNLYVAKFENKLWFVTPEQHLPCDTQYGLSKKQQLNCKKERKPERLTFLKIPDGSSTQRVAQQGLLRIAKVRNLLAIQSALGKQDQALKLDFLIEKGNSNEPVFKLSPKLKTGDWVSLSIKNTSNKGQDVTVFFLDSQYGLQMVYPRSGEPNVLNPSDKPLKLRFQVNVDTTGFEHFIVLNSESTGVVQSFSFMEQPPLSIATRSYTRDSLGKLSPLQQMMKAAKSGMPMTRGLNTGSNEPAPQSGLSIFSWETLL